MQSKISSSEKSDEVFSHLQFKISYARLKLNSFLRCNYTLINNKTITIYKQKYIFINYMEKTLAGHK